MSLVSELPGIVAETALTRSTGGNVRLVDEESRMQVEILTPVPVVAIRLGRGGVSHAPGLRKDKDKKGRKDKDKKGLEFICDYLLVVELNGNTHAVLVELKKTWQCKAKEQLRRSLPLLEYLRSACEVEYESGRDGTRISTGYLIICEKRPLDKQSPKANPAASVQSEVYRNIRIGTYVGTTLSLTILTGAAPATAH